MSIKGWKNKSNAKLKKELRELKREMNYKDNLECLGIANVDAACVKYKFELNKARYKGTHW